MNSKNYFDIKKGILVQSMTNTKTHDIEATLKQINDLKIAGCDLVRVAIFDDKDINAFKELLLKSPLPIIADIHFNYLFALKAIKAGAFKIRLNPGNISSENEIKEIITEAKKFNTIIRIGVNCGSIPSDIVEKTGITAISMISAMDRYLELFKKYDFDNLVLSLKASNPLLNLEVNRIAFKKYKYPLHIGVTEAGTLINGTIKSTVGLAPLLLEGIGNTIRISISANPVKEIEVCINLLNILKIRNDRVDIVSCPTCGRLDYNLFEIVNKIDDYCKNLHFPLRISVLGCVVNGIGEAKHSDIGIAGSRQSGIIFENGKIIKTVKESELFNELKILIDKKYNEFLNKLVK